MGTRPVPKIQCIVFQYISCNKSKIFDEFKCPTPSVEPYRTTQHGLMAFGIFDTTKHLQVNSILSFRRVHYVICFLLGISPASEV